MNKFNYSIAAIAGGLSLSLGGVATAEQNVCDMKILNRTGCEVGDFGPRESPHEIQIIDERPAIRDFREAPTAPRMIRLPPPPGTNPTPGKSLVPFTEAELSKHVGQRITLKGQWNLHSKQKWELVNRDFSVGLYIHEWYSSSVPQASPITDSKSVDNKQRLSAFQHGDVVTATGILYRYSDPANSRKMDVAVARIPDHYFLDENAVSVTKSEW